MSVVDIMIDIETLGTAPGSVILSIGAASTSEELPEFYCKLNVPSQLYSGLTVHSDTMAWWRKQSRAVWENQTNGTAFLASALASFGDWIQAIRNGAPGAATGNRIRVWGDGSTFDCVLLEEAYRRCGLVCPWSYQEVYCYRTLRQLKDSKKPIPKEHHNALSDAQAQLEHLKELLSNA